MSANTNPATPNAPASPRLVVSPATHENRALRVFAFFSVAVLLTGVVSVIFADLLWRTGWTPARTVLLVLFVILFFLAAIGCTHGIFGFFLRRIGEKSNIARLKDYRGQDISGTSTALIFPIYNENVVRVLEGLRATYESLKRTGQLERFDFFILSDSTNPDKWIEEERRWSELVRDLNALGRIYYRRRINNEGKKSGNVRDFLNSWGRRYRYFVCFDADSVMRGETLVDLVKLMEAHPDTGLIQTVPGLMNAESLFGRMQQFANRFYAPIFITGLNFWAQSFGNYWGHNAIIRTEPFMHYCDLPQLPGRKPFGGHILSHDFVEAALMLKENWQVWFAYELEGSYEEAPQGLIENAQRDRRWCQGNLQHAMLLFAKGLRGVSRIHLLLGIFGYLSGPLWLAFLLTFSWIRWNDLLSDLSVLPTRGFLKHLNLSATAHAFFVFSICMTVIMLPKVLALIDLALDPERRRAFGGLIRTALSVIVETIFSTLHAPLQMLWHTRFVITIMLGMGVSWGTQNRDADGTEWSYALRRHWGHVLVGVVWGGLVFWLDRITFWWFLPVLIGMMISIPLSVFTSRSGWGKRARQAGLFLVPEEVSPPQEIVSLRLRMAEMEMAGETVSRPVNSGLADVVLNPYVNAVHVSLLRENRLNPAYAESLTKLGIGSAAVRALGEKLLAAGPDSLTPAEKVLVLSDANTMSWMHRHAWLRPSETFSPWWQQAFRKVSR
jgi:membrane glycosyltransferase